MGLVRLLADQPKLGSANAALWRIVMVRMVFAARTRAGVARHTTRGRSKREVRRFIAREI